jgi:hypothetical protein
MATDGLPPGAARAPEHHVHGYWRRHTAALFRWLHIYLSMVSFAILFFFAVTGLTLNHAEWFSGDKHSTTQRKGQVETKWVKVPDAQVAKLEIAEQLRRNHGVKGTVSEFRLEESQCSVAFKGPGYSADANIDRETGEYELTETRLGFVAVINDLHKGRDSGSRWSLVIDVSAVLMVLVSVTGTVLLLFLKRRRVSGLIAAVVGALLSYLIYALFVP